MKIKEKRELSFIAYDKARLFERRGQKAAVFWKKTTDTGQWIFGKLARPNNT
jgi:hypothetical protein